MAISESAGDVLVTHSLGSCLGFALYDSTMKIGGLLHSMLPLSSTDYPRARKNPAMFVDTGVTKLLEQMFKRGCSRENLVVKVAGGARVLDRQDLFRIGERNYTVFRKVLWKNNLLIAGEDVGGSVSRSVRLELGCGRFYVRTGSEEREL
ncbi:MAG: chemotaxis protein CheD [Kiritimatiellae bacterium]|nr:chemotaxis protein CheD [Kiritimatiellia bacterium]